MQTSATACRPINISSYQLGFIFSSFRLFLFNLFTLSLFHLFTFKSFGESSVPRACYTIGFGGTIGAELHIKHDAIYR